MSSLDKKLVGKIVNFGSAAMLNSTYKKVKAEAEKIGIPVDQREFHCKGEFKGIHKGRPNEEDLKAAAEFAKKIVLSHGTRDAKTESMMKGETHEKDIT